MFARIAIEHLADAVIRIRLAVALGHVDPLRAVGAARVQPSLLRTFPHAQRAVFARVEDETFLDIGLVDAQLAHHRIAMNRHTLDCRNAETVA